MLGIQKISVIGRTYRHLNRYRQISAILLKHGFGDLIELLKIDQYLELGLQIVSRKERDPSEKLTRAQRIRTAIEELGPTYIKFGQMLSTRPDILPSEYVKELELLQDKVPACPFPDILAIIESELKAPCEKIFRHFDQIPLASASIGQVYKAELSDGSPVAVKVQRPGIRKIMTVDLEILLHMATLMERHIPEAALHQPVKIVEEFAACLEREIDYEIEAGNMERMGRLFLSDPTVVIPQVYREMSTGRVLTAEFIEGIKISEIETLTKAGLDLKELMRRGADLYLTQIFEHGFFHADPHPGNIFALPENVICLVDFGMVGRVDRHTREDFVELVDAVVRENESRVVQILLQLTHWEVEPDLREFERDISDFMSQHLYKPLGEVNLGQLLRQLLEITSKHRTRLPPDIFLMIKALATVEGVGRTLDPSFDLLEHAAPFIAKIKLARMSPHRIAEDTSLIVQDTFQFLRQFPRDLREISRLARSGKLSIRTTQADLDTTLSTYDQISNRISFSIIIAALIMGSALIVISEIPPLIFGISFIGIIGFFAAALLGIWLLVAILKKGSL